MAGPLGQPSFDIGGLVQKSWQIVQQNAVVLIGGIVIVAIIQALLSSISAKLGLYNTGSLIVGGPLYLGYCGMALRAARGQSLDITQIFEGFQRFLPSFVANLIISIFIAIGAVLCVIPGLFVAMIYCLTYFYMYDKKSDFWPSMESSRQTIMNALGAWLIVYLVFIALIIAGAMLCGVGLIVTGPIATVMLALAYDQVSGGGRSVGEAPAHGDYQA